MRKSISIVFCFTSLSVITANAANVTIIPPIVVKPQLQFNNNASKRIITRNELNLTGVTNVAQALQTLGNLQIHNSSGNSSEAQISMRGFGANSSSNTLILINGIPLTNPDLAPPDLNLIPLQNVQWIEIISGSQGVTYGDQAVGGVINIITSPKLAHKLNFSCGLGSYNASICYANFNSTYHQWYYAVNGITSHTDNYRDHNDYDQHSLYGNIGYQYLKGKLNFNYRVANEKLLYPGALTHTEVVENRRQATNDSDFFQDWNGYFHLQQEQNINDHWKFNADLFRRDMHGNGVLYSPFNQSRIIYFLKPQLTGTYARTVITAGGDFENDKYNLTSSYGSTTDWQNKYGAFIQADYFVKQNFILNAGIRGAQQNNNLTSFDDVNSLNRATATTVGLKYYFTPEINYYLTRAESFRFPKADEDADTPVGVKTLKTQTGVSYETGVKWNTEKFHTNLEIYQLNLRNEIAFDPFQTPERPFGTNRNLDPTARKGLLFSEKYNINSFLRIGADYNYVNARFQNGIYSGKQIPLVSENIFRADVNYQFRENWNLFAEGIYTGSQYADNDNSNIISPVGGYTVFNANLSYNFKDFSANFRVNNIFNKEYYSYTVFQPSMTSEFFYPAPERNYWVELKLFVM